MTTTTLKELVKLSKNIENCFTIEATVDTGFESMAEFECRKKLCGPEGLIANDRGRIYFNVTFESLSIAQQLRSINNLNLIIDTFENLNLKIDSASKEMNLQILEKLPDEIIWDKYLQLWKHASGFTGELSNSNDDNIDKKSDNGTLRYRVTCYRAGHVSDHTFCSQDAARAFGGRLQDKFNWEVNLSEHELEVILEVIKDEAIVGIKLTVSSKHKRNITHYGFTTLRSTISYNLIQLAEPIAGDIILDPMCGSGSIPIEGTVGFPGTYCICGDIDTKSVIKTHTNVEAYYELLGKRLLVNSVHWNACSLPLRTASVDIVTTDLPFGKRVGNRYLNRGLYCDSFKEMARVLRPNTGRVVLLTMDRASYHIGLRASKPYLKESKVLRVKVGGLKVCAYLLKRTSALF